MPPRASGGDTVPALVQRRLDFTPPLEASNLYGHLTATAVPGVEEWREGAYRAAVRLAGGPAVVRVGRPADGRVPVELRLTDQADAASALDRVRRTFDMEVDPTAVAQVLSADPVLAPLVAAAPGRRAPGTLDPEAMVLRAVLGQQVSTAAARTHAGRLVAAFGEPVDDPDGGLTHLFPAAERLAERLPDVIASLGMPESRKRTFAGVVAALAERRIDLAAPPAEVRASLLELPGVGPWTADTVLMRALGDPDGFLPTDLGVIAAARALGLPDRPRDLLARAERWRPYRSYAVQYLWATLPHAVNRMPGR